MIIGTTGDLDISNLNRYAQNEYEHNFFFKEIANIMADNSRGM